MSAFAFWEWFEKERARRDLSYAQIEANAGMGNAALYKAAKNQKQPTLYVLKAIALAFKMPLPAVLVRSGDMPPFPPVQDDEQQILEAYRRLKPHERATMKRALLGLVESAPAKVSQRGEREEIPGEGEDPLQPLGEKAFDQNEIAVIMVDTVTTILSPETLRLVATLLQRRAADKERGKHLDPDDDISPFAERLRQKTGSLPENSTGAPVFDED